ncbi:helix-turn-helix transcriptional regulator [Mariniflexile gromovii]|uniref:Helix-turn-helix transcriptional regulator n=1 Tax=Mariniflexile gromovii TaxID=362523 RepID=A0ABS4BWS7_9FLAO|nr:helix-turn-helix transcriptional regulator [Mariniflexile gromovii]MBP0905044.1 helix-turn-helix transcriptional regulator [Mariniflexile gromovii]
MIVANKFPSQEIKNKLKNIVSDGGLNSIKWPDIVIHTTVNKHSSNIPESSFSILSINQEGVAHINLKNRKLKICNNTFMVLTPFQTFDYIIDYSLPIEILNVHLSIETYHGINAAFTKDHGKLLDFPFDIWDGDVLTSHINFKPEAFTFLLNNYNNQQDDETYIMNIVNHMIFLNRENLRLINNIQGTKSSTKIELFKRMFLAKDIIYSQFNDPQLNLEYLSREVYMSRFHFLRVFKQTFGITPYQMIRDIRINKIIEMISQKNKNINEISMNVGLREPNSVYALFKKGASFNKNLVK